MKKSKEGLKAGRLSESQEVQMLKCRVEIKAEMGQMQRNDYPQSLF